jgi:magnesium-transporting ATPase (P-type)
MCIAVGENSLQKMTISGLATKSSPEVTFLAESLNDVSTRTQKYANITALLILNLPMLHYFMDLLNRKEVFLLSFGAVQGWLNSLLLAVTVFMVAVPEGLTLTVMVTLAYTCKGMSNDMLDVKRLSAPEMLASID